MSVTHVLQAEEIAEKLCESVAASLEGKKLGSFTRISSTVQVRELEVGTFIHLQSRALSSFKVLELGGTMPFKKCSSPRSLKSYPSTSSSF